MDRLALARTTPCVLRRELDTRETAPAYMYNLWMTEEVEIHTAGVAFPRGLLRGLSALHMQALLKQQ
jgi:hypothetical protein